MHELSFAEVPKGSVTRAPAVAQERTQLAVAGAKLEIVFSETPQGSLRSAVLEWIGTSARAVATFPDRNLILSDLALGPDVAVKRL